MSTAERTFPTPVYAVVGAGDVAVQEVKDAFAELRTRVETSRERAEARAEETRTWFGELPTELPSIDELRSKLTQDELTKFAGPYIEAATGLYSSLAERGETAVERLRSTPAVEESLARVEKVYSEAVDLTEDALGAVSTQTRAVGERAAALAGRTAERVEDTAVAVEQAGTKAKADADAAADKVSADAAELKKTAQSRKPAAKKAAPAKKAAAKSTTAKSTTAKSTAAKSSAK
ncbi:hypothetical protein [Gordonia shandongensis]|uniref:hypothetical protein n=1 Tax=Gordonia shandongensis TaxID=376351 RepID=UPI00041C69AE|nr:hypothetical protein [Gordonia shandongensis]